MISLREVLQTRYIIDSKQSDLRKILEQNDEVDISLCRFSPTCASILSSFAGKVKLSNTAEPLLHDLLVRDRLAVTTPASKMEVLRTEFSSLQDLSEYLDSELDSSVIYKLSPDKNIISQFTKTFAALILMYRADITIDLEIYASDVFMLVRDTWLKERKLHNQYQRVYGAAILSYEVINGKVLTHDCGAMDVNLFIESYNVLPMKFGNKCVFTTNSSDEFYHTTRRILSSIETMMYPKRTQAVARTMSSVIRLH